MITVEQLIALKKLYTTVIRTVGNTAYDADGNEVEYNLTQVQALIDSKAYMENRALEYPPIADYIDGVVKGDQEQIDAYIAACQAVKTKYPKPE
jgi:hypothetical protein